MMNLTPEQKKEALDLIKKTGKAIAWAGIKFFIGLLLLDIFSLIFAHLLMGEVDQSTWKWCSFSICLTNALFLGRNFHLRIGGLNDKLKEDLLKIQNQ